MARVLIVDDNPLFREMLKRHVADAFGFETVEAEDGFKAVALAGQHPPDLVLMDMVMPDLSGVEAIRRLRAMPAMADVPILSLSAETDRQAWVEAFEAGANDFIPKPYERRELIARIGTHLKLYRLGRELKAQNALLERERYLAGCVQRQLLPKRLDFAGLETAAVYQAQEQVGGDFYDAWEDGDAVTFLMADISGHGASAALLMAVCKGLVVSLRESRPPPEAVMAELDRMICGLLADGDLDMYVTLVLATIDRAAGTLAYLSAGHVPCFLLTPAGVQALPSTGPALGLDGDFVWSTASRPMRPGDTLFLYTDGLVDLRSPAGEFFGEDRLMALLAPGQPPQETIGEIIEHALPFCRGILHDDLAIMAIRRR